MDLQSFFNPKQRKTENDASKPVKYIHVGNPWKKFLGAGLRAIAERIAGGKSTAEKTEVKHTQAIQRVTGKVTTRIAPSPTGMLHIGTARSALFNYLFAKQHDGIFIVRIEDTDTKRSKKEYEEDIIENLNWLGLAYDGFYRQSERRDIYTAHINRLIDSDKAYVSKETGKDGSGGTVEVVRLRNQNKTIVFDDMIRGTISFDTTELGDFILARSVSDPLYHFAAVVDDYDMKITHVIRGEDHISNTPRQILIQEALGFPRPYYAHMPLILNPDRTKMSKRGEGGTVREYRLEGYYPEAFLNYLALLGWNPGSDREIFTLTELIKEFDIAKIGRSPAIFNKEKLQWFNRNFLRTIPQSKIERTITEVLPGRLKTVPDSRKIIKRLIPMLQEKIRTTADISRMVESGELDYLFLRPDIDSAGLSRKGEISNETMSAHLTHIVSLLEHIPAGAFTADAVKHALWDYATEKGRGEVLWPMRYALSGRDKSSDSFTIAEIIGKKETKERLLNVLHTLERV